MTNENNAAQVNTGAQVNAGAQVHPNQNVESGGLSEMQIWVMKFMETRKNQDAKFSGKKMKSVYIQTVRVDRLKEYICNKFTGAGLMKESEIYDFMFYLLENYLNGQNGDLECFNEFYEREFGIKNNG